MLKTTKSCRTDGSVTKSSQESGGARILEQSLYGGVNYGVVVPQAQAALLL